MSGKFVNFGVPICLFCFFLVVIMWKNYDVHFFANKNQLWIIQNASEVINLTLSVKGESITWRFAVSLCQHADFYIIFVWCGCESCTGLSLIIMPYYYYCAMSRLSQEAMSGNWNKSLIRPEWLRVDKGGLVHEITILTSDLHLSQWVRSY